MKNIKYKALDNTNVIVGNKIRARRQELHLTQKELANALHCTFQQVQKYESGQNKVSISRLFAICDILGCRPNYFLDGFNLSESFRPAEDILEKQLLTIFRQLKTLEMKQEALKVLSLVLNIQNLFK